MSPCAKTTKISAPPRPKPEETRPPSYLRTAERLDFPGRLEKVAVIYLGRNGVVRLTRFVPVQAGEPLGEPLNPNARSVYPRVGGGTNSTTKIHLTGPGLSPRGRGNLVPRVTAVLDMRSIPAWAGEPFQNGLVLPLCQVYPRVGGGSTMLKDNFSSTP